MTSKHLSKLTFYFKLTNSTIELVELYFYFVLHKHVNFNFKVHWSALKRATLFYVVT